MKERKKEGNNFFEFFFEVLKFEFSKFEFELESDFIIVQTKDDWNHPCSN